MGYTTKFDGHFAITPPLNAEARAIYKGLYCYEIDESVSWPVDGYNQWEVTGEGLPDLVAKREGPCRSKTCRGATRPLRLHVERIGREPSC